MKGRLDSQDPTHSEECSKQRAEPITTSNALRHGASGALSQPRGHPSTDPQAEVALPSVQRVAQRQAQPVRKACNFADCSQTA